MENSINSKRGIFSGSVGFVLAAAGSAVGLGNIWRFPYLAAKNGGGLFLLCYIILVFTFGFALLTSEVAIGRKTRQGPLTAYSKMHPKFGFLGVLACVVPIIIIPYYCAIGGWVLKYLCVFITGHGSAAAQDKYFTGFITSQWSPIIYMLVFLALCAVVVYLGVDKGIEKSSKILMPILFLIVLGISIFALTVKKGDTTGIDGLKVYVTPDFSKVTPKGLFSTIMDAVGQLFYSISVAMGIMIAYGSYVPKESDISKSIFQIELFDTLVAMLAGMMIIPAVYVFSGVEGMNAGPGLIFVSLPKIFLEMGKVGPVIAILFFVLVSFAAITSAVSIMEAIVSSICDKFHVSRRRGTTITTVYAAVVGILICLGYNVLYFDFKLPNGTVGQLLDIFDYASNNVLMPIVAICTCILIGWVLKCNSIIDEIKIGAEKVHRQTLYVIMTKFVVPVILTLLLIEAFIRF